MKNTMKWVIFGILFAASAQAAVTGHESNYGCDDHNMLCNIFMGPLSTTSFPTMMIEGVELDMKSGEANDRIKAEAHGDVDPVILSRIAQEAQVSVEQAKSATLDLESQGRLDSVDSVLQYLSARNEAQDHQKSKINESGSKSLETPETGPSSESASFAGTAR